MNRILVFILKSSFLFLNAITICIYNICLFLIKHTNTLVGAQIYTCGNFDEAYVLIQLYSNQNMGYFQNKN